MFKAPSRRQKARTLGGLPISAPDEAKAAKPPSRRLKARMLTGRTECHDKGAQAAEALQRAHYTEHRIPFDPFDARPRCEKPNSSASVVIAS